MNRFPPVGPGLPHMIHGADYNPEQWLHAPEILAEDLRLMKEARCNAASVGVFAWSALEPVEGHFRFDWLDRVMDGLAEQGIRTILSTPSGSRPAWLARRYPEVLRVGSDRRRNLHGLRHNHCYTSPVYREKTQAINRRLAERYAAHPALLMWHLSNEYGGECHCGLCQEAFRDWLRRRYRDDLGSLNLAWWTSFWSHTYSDWAEIESPAPHGEYLLPALSLDWKRFVTEQTVDFMRSEMTPLREITPAVPITTNMMGTYAGLDYRRFAEHLDVISWDSYPCWHGSGPLLDASHWWDAQGRDWLVAADTAFAHDLMRTLKGRPFMLMESSPTFSNWHPVHKLKRPGMHLLSSLLAVAHGSDTVQYFQWRKSRGGVEKLHGAVVDHSGEARTRVFREVAETGRVLAALDEIVGSWTPAETAVVYDWENRWALEAASPVGSGVHRGYERTCKEHHYPFWSLGVPVDVIQADSALDRYRLLVAPLLYMVRPGVAEALERFVSAGGTLVATYWSGIVDAQDSCFLGGFPGPLRRLLGIRSEETDSLYPGERNAVVMVDPDELGLSGEYQAEEFCDLIQAESARVLAEYRRDFYSGRPALTVNSLGRGKAYYIASRNEERFLNDFYAALVRRLELARAVEGPLPQGVTAQMRCDGTHRFVFLLNFTSEPKRVDLGDRRHQDLLNGRPVRGVVALEGFQVRVLRTHM